MSGFANYNNYGAQNWSNNAQAGSYMGNGYGYSQPAPSQQINYNSSYIRGRIVNSEGDIIPNEVPMDGSLGVFIQQDLKRIYTKTWGGDGRIHTDVYALVNPTQMNEGQNEDPIRIIMDRLTNIENALKDRRKYQQKRSFNNKDKYQSRVEEKEIPANE